MCDEIGIDTIEMAGTMMVAMEAGILPWGDGEGVLKLLDEVKNGTNLGRIIGNGADFTGKAFGVTRIPTVKSQPIPAVLSSLSVVEAVKIIVGREVSLRNAWLQVDLLDMEFERFDLS